MTWREIMQAITKMRAEDFDKEAIVVAENNNKLHNVELVALDFDTDTPYLAGNVVETDMV